jgi:hypothetical protein
MNINIKELRIGNLIMSDLNEPSRVTAIYKNSIECQFDETGWKSVFNPKSIPFTEEWLFRFGFEKMKISREAWDFSIKGDVDGLKFKDEIFFTLETIDYTFKWDDKNREFYLNDNRIDDFCCVHQLQNLYFALTGKELELQDNATN